MVDTDGDDKIVYSCEGCGSHRFSVVWSMRATTYYTDTLPCKCGGVNDGIAAVRSYHVNREYVTRRLLYKRHQWDEVLTIDSPHDYDDETTVKEDGEHEVYCYRCEERAEEGDWEVGEGKTAEGDPEWSIYCSWCLQVWLVTHLKAERVWPVEGSDPGPPTT